MKPGPHTTLLVIIIAVVSLIGLSVIQLRWLSDSVQLHRSIFYRQADLATKAVGDQIRDTQLADRLVVELQADKPVNSRTYREVNVLVDSILSLYNISTPRTYGLYKHNHQADDEYQWVGGTATGQVPLNLSCPSQERSFGWTDLVCGPPGGRSSYFLGIFFPHTDLYLLSTMKGTWLTTLLFVGLLVVCFVYTITTIRKQKKLSDMKNDFINNLTHEFKTPIFSIDLASGMLRKAPELQRSDKLLRYVEVIDGEGKRLKNQVDKVLQVALVDSDNFRLEKRKIEMHGLIHQVVKSFMLQIHQRGGTIELCLQAQNSRLFADETHLNNVLYNLLDNAQKYSPGQPKIKITTQDKPHGLQLSIQDGGIGIDQPMQQYIFDKFYRGTTDVPEVKGFGLGLSYVKSVMEAHGAQISLASVPRVGSTFTLTFNV